MRKLVGTFTLVLMALGLFITPASAIVTFDPATGTGFAGKGDVFPGMSNKDMNSAAGSVAFTYNDTVEYDVPCKKETTRQTLRNSYDRSQSVSATVAYDTRNNKQGNLTGFNLDGFVDQPVLSGNVECPGGWEPDGVPVLVGASGGGLYANGNLIWTSSAP